MSGIIDITILNHHSGDVIKYCSYNDDQKYAITSDVVCAMSARFKDMAGSLNTQCIIQCVDGCKLCYSNLGIYNVLMRFSVGSSLIVTDAYVRHVVTQVRDILLFYLGQYVFDGDCKEYREHVLSCFDLIDLCIKRNQSHDIMYLCAHDCIRAQPLDRLQLELLDSFFATHIYSNQKIVASCLLLGPVNTVLHGRISRAWAYMAIHHLNTRSMSDTVVRSVPVFSDGSWQLMVFLQVQGIVLTVFMDTSTSMKEIYALHQVFVTFLTTSDIHLPTESAPVLLHNFTSHSVLAFTYVHHNSGVCLGATSRFGSEATQAKLKKVYNWFALPALFPEIGAQVAESIQCQDGYMLVCRHNTEYTLLALVPQALTVGRVHEVADNIAQQASVYARNCTNNT